MSKAIEWYEDDTAPLVIEVVDATNTAMDVSDASAATFRVTAHTLGASAVVDLSLGSGVEFQDDGSDGLFEVTIPVGLVTAETVEHGKRYRCEFVVTSATLGGKTTVLGGADQEIVFYESL